MIIYKIGIMTAVLTSSILASGNPFAVEQNVKKIDQEEGMLLDAIAKEQATQEVQDELFDEKSSHTKTKIVSPKIAEESVKIKKREITKITPPVVEVKEIKAPPAVNPEIEKESVEIKKSEVTKITPPVVNNITPEAKAKEEKQEVIKQEVVKISPVKAVAPKVLPVVVPIVVPKKKTTEKPVVAKRIEEVDAQIKKVDAQIKKLQDNLNASKKKKEASEKRADADKKRANQSQKKADVNKKKSDISQKKPVVVEKKKPVVKEKKAIVSEGSEEETETPESANSIFERELQEAIESVR